MRSACRIARVGNLNLSFFGEFGTLIGQAFIQTPNRAYPHLPICHHAYYKGALVINAERGESILKPQPM
jgi:hypothetical protein